MDPLLDRLDPDDRKRLRRAAMPAFTPPMLATLTKQVFSDPVWVYEPKLDGQRSLLWRRGSTVRLITRNEKDRTSHYPDLTGAILRDETPPLLADGEIVAFDGDVTSFSRLQARMQNARPSTVQVAAVSFGTDPQTCAVEAGLGLDVTNNSFVYVQAHPRIAGTAPGLTDQKSFVQACKDMDTSEDQLEAVLRAELWAIDQILTNEPPAKNSSGEQLSSQCEPS